MLCDLLRVDGWVSFFFLGYGQEHWTFIKRVVWPWCGSTNCFDDSAHHVLKREGKGWSDGVG